MIKTIINPKEYKSILCLNGDLPESKFFEMFELPIIAADGAANSLDSIGIFPDIVIGDLDSVKKELLFDGKFIKNTDQNSSDFQKAMNYLEDQDLLPAIILGINGGYLDHIINNINIFLKTKSVFFCDNIVGMVLNGVYIFDLEIGMKLSIFGIPKCTISTNGLKWNLDNSEMAFPGYNSCFNRVKEEKVEINIKQGNALLLIYTKNIIDAGF